MSYTQCVLEVAQLDPKKPLDVETFQFRLRNATSDCLRQMLALTASTNLLITAMLAETKSPQRMLFLAKMLVSAAKEVSLVTHYFTALYQSCLGYDQASSIGNLDDVDKARVEMGYAISACLPLLPRTTLEHVAIKFSEYVQVCMTKETQSMIDIVQDREMVERAVPEKKNRTAPTVDHEYIYELDKDGLQEIVSRAERVLKHIEMVKHVALSRLVEEFDSEDDVSLESYD